MPIEPTEKFITDTLQAPINNMVIAIAGLALLIVILVIVLMWKAAPFLVKFLNGMMENIQKLTTLEQQNSEQSKNILEGLNKNTAEMSKQTTVIESLGRDTRSYQTLVSDNLSTHTEQIAANTAKLDTLQESQAALRKSIDDLTAQITKMLTDDRDCISFTQELKAIEDRIVTRLQQPTQAVATHSVTVDVAPVESKAA